MIKAIIFFIGLFVASSVFSGELKTRTEIGNSVKALFTSGDYESLNAMGYSYLNNKSRTSSGLWKLTFYYSGLSYAMSSNTSDPQYWLALKKKLLVWSELDQESSFPHMLYVDLLISEAWMHRGSGWAKNVRKEDWKPFREKIEEARLYLERYSHFKEKDPQWYESMLQIAKAQDWHVNRFYILLNEALDTYPQFYEIYFRAINYLQPRWHGSADEIEQFANYATSKSRQYENNGMYARIYWYVSQAEYGNRLFTKSKVRWEQMRLGINDVIKQYPDQWNINNFALFSCLAKDKKMTQKLMSILKGKPIMRVWKDDKSFNYCKNFGAPVKT